MSMIASSSVAAVLSKSWVKKTRWLLLPKLTVVETIVSEVVVETAMMIVHVAAEVAVAVAVVVVDAAEDAEMAVAAADVIATEFSGE